MSGLYFQVTTNCTICDTAIIDDKTHTHTHITVYQTIQVKRLLLLSTMMQINVKRVSTWLHVSKAIFGVRFI